MAESASFGWQMAAEVKRRGLERARRKACVCDGQQYNWTLFETHLVPWGFIGILDLVHLLAYWHDAAHAWQKERPGLEAICAVAALGVGGPSEATIEEPASSGLGVDCAASGRRRQ